MNRRFTAVSRLLVATVAAILLASCGPKPQQPLSHLDTPEHHTATGIKLLKQEKIAAAEQEFELALRLDSRYAKAVAGAGLVKAYRADFPGAREALRRAEQNSRDDGETLFALVAAIRVHALSRASCLKLAGGCTADDGWLASAKEIFERALRIDPKAADAHYFMGECYLAAQEWEKAGRLFSRVLDFNGDYVEQADARWRLAQKIQRAMPGSAAGKKIALVERITRADVAALFMEELGIDALYVRRLPKIVDKAFTDPQQSRGGRRTATDIAGHPLREDIEGIIRIGARGLEIYPDGTFRPDEAVDRASYAMMIEDILIRVTGDTTLATRFIGSPSPFPDLRSDLPYFNAVMVVTSRGIMEARDMMTGEFAPLLPVGGSDALLVIRRIKEELR